MNSESSSIEIKIAKAVSYIFHPVFYPLLGLYLFFHSGTYLDTMNEDGKNFLYTIVAFSTCVLPLLSMPVFMYRRMVRNIEMDNRSERIFPLAFILIFYFIGYYMVKNLPLPVVLSGYIAAITILAAITLFITIWWKISFHLIGIGGLLGSLIAVSLRLEAGIQNYIIGVVILTGIVATARLLLKAHTGWQLLAGFVTGFAVCFSWIYFF
jgi:hypothetical protein